jgi:hypothetical protein
MAETCPACGTERSDTCPLCRERTYRVTPLLILGTFPWTNHRLVWDGPQMGAMHCDRCGKPIHPYTTMKELIGPCSAGATIVR